MFVVQVGRPVFWYISCFLCSAERGFYLSKRLFNVVFVISAHKTQTIFVICEGSVEFLKKQKKTKKNLHLGRLYVIIIKRDCADMR